MNAGKIKALRYAASNSEVMYLAGVPAVIVTQEELIKLLDEREALLKALKKRGACTSPACLGSYLASCEVVKKVES